MNTPRQLPNSEALTSETTTHELIQSLFLENGSICKWKPTFTNAAYFAVWVGALKLHRHPTYKWTLFQPRSMSHAHLHIDPISTIYIYIYTSL